MNCEWPRVIFDSGHGIGRERYRFLGELATEAAKQGTTEAELLKTGKYIVVPCNKCLACKMRKSAEWAARAAQEAEYYPEGERWFVTLTYDEDNLPRYYASLGEVISGGNPIGGVPTLHHKDVQDFLKRVRKAERDEAQREGREERKLKFLMSGEYGDQTGRPHYHLIIFGLEIPDFQPVKVDRGVIHYRSDWLQTKWGRGIVDIEEYSLTNAQYVAQYTVKKAYGYQAQAKYQELGIRAPYLVVSNGFSGRWVAEHQDEILAGKGESYLPTKHGTRIAPPSAYAQRKVRRLRTAAEIEQRKNDSIDRQIRRLEHIRWNGGGRTPEEYRKDQAAAFQAKMTAGKMRNKQL